MILFQCLVYSAKTNYTELYINKLYVKVHILGKKVKKIPDRLYIYIYNIYLNMDGVLEN